MIQHCQFCDRIFNTDLPKCPHCGGTKDRFPQDQTPKREVIKEKDQKYYLSEISANLKEMLMVLKEMRFYMQQENAERVEKERKKSSK